MMQLEDQNEWFATWFDSPYYHILYKNRDENEAYDFLVKLTNYLNLPAGSHVLDLACGAGRHSRVLGKLGFKVTGCDLSENSINEAKRCAPEGMEFFVHDMRNELPSTYDSIFNLFTSFGYFDSKEDNAKVLSSVFKALENDGILVIDFMNASKVVKHLKDLYELKTDGIDFHIRKQFCDGIIQKCIEFEDKGKFYKFQEKVQALTFSDFQTLLTNAGFEIQTTFGSYGLDSFDEETSDRLILICKKL